MMKSIIENINLHKKKSVVPIWDNQVTYIPTVWDNQIEYMTFSYSVEGKRVIINQGNQCCFRLRFLKLKLMPPRKALAYKSGTWSMNELVDNDVIYPFMLFINGRFIPWNLISLVFTQDSKFIVVNAAQDYRYISVVRDVNYAQIVNLPSHIVYDVGYHNIDDSVVFSFSDYGFYDPWAREHIVRNISDGNHIIHKFWTTTSGVNAFPVLEETTSVKLTKDNVVLFKNGLLATGTKEKIKKAFDSTHTYEDTGYKADCLEFDTEEGDLEANPIVKFDSELLTIGDGTLDEGVRLDFGVFINTKYTPTADNINRTDLDGLAPYIKDQNAGINNPQFLQDLQIPFELSMDRTKKYDENVANAIKTMITYNASLFNKVFEEASNLVIEEHSGEWVLAAMDNDGVLNLSRYHSNMIDEYIIMLVNGELYQYYNMSKYKANKCLIPIQGIRSSDTIELLRFQNVNNYDAAITVYEDEGFVPRSPEIINEEMMLFSTVTDESTYTYPSDGLQHFPVEYHLETNEEGNIKITFSNPFYYGKQLHLVYKNRFIHYRYNLSETTPEKYSVDLGNKFMYCHDYSKYFIFYNGRKLGSDQYRLTLPVRTGTPFSKFEIYLTMPINDGDKLDVIYVSSMMKDVILIPEIPVTGDIVIDKSKLGYGLSTDLYMVWVNGKKIPKSKIVDIDSTHIRIISDVQSTKMVCVTKYIPDIDELSSVFKENEALWDSVMAQLTNDEIYALLGITGENLTDTEPGVFDDAIDVKTIMYELIREQFMMNPNVDITGAFVYDYLDVDTTAVDSYDSSGDAILPVADANRTDNLSDVKREWP